MTDTWILEPRDTLVLGDGRPMEAGLPRRSLPFPWPTSVAGTLRTRVGLDDAGHFGLSPDEARAIEVKGPWLAELDHEGRVAEFIVPAPRDCVWHPETSRPERMVRRRLVPHDPPAGAQTDLDTSLRLVTVASQAPDEKPLSGPSFWRWTDLTEWLTAPPEAQVLPADFGLDALDAERRMHVSIEEGSSTAAEGLLFASEGLRFSTRERGRLALLAECRDQRLTPGVVPLGGERRPTILRQEPAWSLPHAPQEVVPAREGLARVVLLTPGAFDAGFAPREVHGARVVAAVVPRPQVISGWDYAKRGPKPSRRLAPSGSVYWVRLGSGTDPQTWVEKVWMQSVSEAEQDRRDGFGVAVVGVA